MSPVRARHLAWSLAALALAIEIAYYVIVLSAATYEFAFFNLLRSAFVLVFATLGALVATRQPRNGVGWIFLGVALTSGLFDLGYAVIESRLQTGTDPGALVELAAAGVNVGWVPGIFVSATFLLLLFPDGRPPSRRWNAVAWSAGAGIVALLVSYGTIAGPLDNFPAIDNPLGVGASVTGPLSALATLLLTVGLLGSVASVVVRFRHAGYVQRQQIKWLATAGAVVVAAIVFRAASETTVDSNVTNAVLLSAVLGIPVSIAIAILRHRLYDIDVVINRALVYGVLTATLAVSYLGAVLLLQLALSPVTESSSLAIAASTLAVAALFRPVRKRIQSLVDRRFFRSKYDAARTLEQFGAQLRDEVDLETLGDELRAVVAQTMQPAHVTLWLRVPSEPS